MSKQITVRVTVRDTATGERASIERRYSEFLLSSTNYDGWVGKETEEAITQLRNLKEN